MKTKNKFLIFGKGYLGQRLQKELHCPISHQRIHILEDIVKEIKKYNPQCVINCIGETGKRNVDDCELSIDKTMEANAFIPILFAEAAYRHKFKLIHISSGCIYHFEYGKTKPITEHAIPDYYDLYYSRTKIYAENVLDEMAKRRNILILRVRIPLDDRPNPKNIIDKLIRYKTVIDVPNSITYIPDFIKAVKHLVKIDARGIYNTVCKGGLRYSTLMKLYARYVPGFQYKVIPLKDLKLVRTNLVLSTQKLEKTGFKVRRAYDALEECLKRYIKY